MGVGCEVVRRKEEEDVHLDLRFHVHLDLRSTCVGHRCEGREGEMQHVARPVHRQRRVQRHPDQ